MPGIRVIVYNADEPFGPMLRAMLQSFDGVKIVAEVDEPTLLSQAVAQFAAEVLIVHLDPVPEVLLPTAGEIANANPDLSVFAISDSTDGQLILAALRLGLKEFLTKPIDPAIIGSAIAKVSERRVETVSTGRLVAVIGTAGGVGATSLATNLAVELASVAEKPVAVVDLDYRFGQVATFLDVDPTYTIADLCESPERLEHSVIERTLVTHASGIHVLARPNSFVQADGITAAHCVGVLTMLLTLHEYVVVDGPSRFDMGAKAVLDIADCSLLLMQLTVPSVRSAARMLDGMQQAGFNLDRIKLVCNRVGRESSSLSVADVNSTLNREVFATLADDWASMSAAINFGEPLCVSHPKSKLRLGIRELAERLHGPLVAAGSEEKPAPRKGKLLSKVFSGA